MREFRINNKNIVYEKFHNEPGGVWIDIGKISFHKKIEKYLSEPEKIHFFLKNYKNYNLKFKEHILINGRLIII